MLPWTQTSIAEHVLKMVGLMRKLKCQRKLHFSNRELNIAEQMTLTKKCASQTEIEWTFFP